MKLSSALLSAFGILGGLALAASPAAADQEQQIGQQVYAQLQQKGEIIPSSPMYSVLNPIAARIKTVTDPQYEYPFQFILVHESSPNAFAVPGGNVYVTDSLMHFVKNKEELAGVLCHETSHDIHHDVANLMQKNQTQGTIIGILGALTGLDRSGLGQIGESMAYTLQSNRFSRGVETAADLKGSETCAQSGFNPHGMIWLFDAFQKAGNGGGAEFLSDHPRDDHRIADLERHFAGNPTLFSKFSADESRGTPFKLPAENAPSEGPLGSGPVNQNGAPSGRRTGPGGYPGGPGGQGRQPQGRGGAGGPQGPGAPQGGAGTPQGGGDPSDDEDDGS